MPGGRGGRDDSDKSVDFVHTKSPATVQLLFVSFCRLVVLCSPSTWRCESLKYAGTVMTALATLSLRNLAASSVSLRSTRALISSGAKFFPALGLLIFTLEFSSTT